MKTRIEQKEQQINPMKDEISEKRKEIESYTQKSQKDSDQKGKEIILLNNNIKNLTEKQSKYEKEYEELMS